MKQQVIGWQGITVDAPDDWSLTGFGGDFKAGSLRADSGHPDAKGQPIGIEIRWSEHNKPQNDAKLGERVTPLLKGIEKTAKRKKVPVETWSGEPTSASREDRPSEIAFSWKAGQAAIGRIWYCATCGRVVIAQVYGSGGPRFTELANRMLVAIGCHGDEIGWRVWSLYGLETSVPADFVLSSQQVMNIYLQLKLTRGRSDDKVTVEQWSLANVQLKGAYLDQWFDSKAAKGLEYVTYEKAEYEVNGHPALALTGRRGGLLFWLAEGIRDLLKLRIPATYYSGIVWECPENNKAYLVQAFTRKKGEMIAQEIASRTWCHHE